MLVEKKSMDCITDTKYGTVLCQGFRIRDKETESLYLVHPLTYRQVYLTKVAYFGENIHCVLKNGLKSLL